MSIVFPGMDPYLENPATFPGIHGPLCTYLRDQLVSQIRPRYIASVGERVIVESYGDMYAIIPDGWMRRNDRREEGGTATLEADAPLIVEVLDTEITQPFIEILDREADMRVVTVIEIISPTNKFSGPGRVSYVTKQAEILASTTHLVEIDLLRRGPHVVAVPERLVRGRNDYDYVICTSRARFPRSRYEVYLRTVRQRLPRIQVPLADGDADVQLDLRAGIEQAYDAGSYAVRIQYGCPCEPSLSAVDQAWADELARQARPATA